MKKTLKMALCEGRHPIPQAVDGAVFRNTIADPTDLAKLDRLAFEGVWYAALRHYHKGEQGYLVVDPNWDEYDETPLVLAKGLHLDLYVTGLTVALVAVLNVCRQEGVTVTLYHYDRETGGYFPQEVR